MSVNSGGKPPDPPPRKPIIFDSQNDAEQMELSVSTPIPINLTTKNNNQYPNDPNTTNMNVNNETKQNLKEVRQAFLFNSNDRGPYHVYIENSSTDFKGKINSLKIGEIILSNFPEADNMMSSIDAIGRNRIRVKCKDYKTENNLVKNKSLEIFRSNNLDLYIPKFILHRQGVIRDIDIDFSEESNITNNDTNFSQNSQPSTSTQGNNFAKFIFNPHTNTSRPNKRQKPNSPDPTDIARKEIISVVSPPKHSEGIVKSQFYQQNLNVADSQSEDLDSSVINVILESVLTIVNSIKQNNNFNISKSDVIQLISNHSNQNLTSNRRPN
ncbi:homeobox protein 4-like [Diabrotica virgifera virgifera]|uniref:Uncharacterized protein n=1 Tax=Diabrotica virgifera virgifera TaxID=50390 RepID=A0ABM5JSM6_DIAVI|nr:homeobox protein 4-like [Diabrotica virgifera virgifera]